MFSLCVAGKNISPEKHHACLCGLTWIFERVSSIIAFFFHTLVAVEISGLWLWCSWLVCVLGFILLTLNMSSVMQAKLKAWEMSGFFTIYYFIAAFNDFTHACWRESFNSYKVQHEECFLWEVLYANMLLIMSGNGLNEWMNEWGFAAELTPHINSVHNEGGAIGLFH